MKNTIMISFTLEIVILKKLYINVSILKTLETFLDN